MKTVHYIGFDNRICSCEYATGTIDGRPCLVVKQTSNSTTSITNKIEDIVSQLLATDLFGIDATQLRVFEFYPPELNPLAVWHEVGFEGVQKRNPRKTIVQKLVELVSPTEQPYVVWNPGWNGVRPELQQQLAKIQ